MDNLEQHFSSIADNYRHLRTTDRNPILFIQRQLNPQAELRAADVGCGTGRYSKMLYELLGPKFFLYCIDGNLEMLRQLTELLRRHHIRDFVPLLCFGRTLPLRANSLDFVCTFNAIHHFVVIDFLNETCRTLKDDGCLFVYTRTRTQNRRNIWGRYFPLFAEKETRLFEEDEFAHLVGSVDGLELERAETFRYARRDTIERLCEKASNHHYSTFCLYSTVEIAQALLDFRHRLLRSFADPHITWHDENTLFVVRKRTSTTSVLSH